MTDGDPTAFDFDQPGDPFDPGPPPDVGVNTNRGLAAAPTMARAVASADAIKGAGTRIMAVGVGAALGNAASRQRLIDIAGPQVVGDGPGDIGLDDVDSINEVDVALVTEFEDLAAFLRNVVSHLCSPSLSIRKLAQSADSAQYQSRVGWDFTVTPTMVGGAGFEWLLPDTDPAQAATCTGVGDPDDEAARTCPTNALGVASFQWEPNPSTASSSVLVEEQIQDPDLFAGNPDGDDVVCFVKDPDGEETVVRGELTDAGGGVWSFEIDVDAEQIVTCSVYNSFDYEPAITLTKLNAPTVVRADLSPALREVTSTYVATNVGNTPLANIMLSDDDGDRYCADIQFVSSSGDGDLLLEPGESWTFTCTTPVNGNPGALDNVAVVVGTAPNGEQVDATATDDVEVVRPDIELTKGVAVTGSGDPPVPAIEVASGASVTYTFSATNTGTVALTDVTLTDGDCDDGTISPAVVPLLAAGASVEFTCTRANLTDDVVNVAEVTGQPVIPDYPDDRDNPAVTAAAAAVVRVLEVGLSLTKSVSDDLVYPGTEVTYTYQVSIPDPDFAPLVPTDADGTPVGRDGWVVDSVCVAPTYVDGDTNGDELLDADETWTYTCLQTIDVATINFGLIGAVVNVADVYAVPESVPDEVLHERDLQVVRVVVPLVAIEKSVSRSSVLEPATTCDSGDPCGPIAGPDVPSPEPVTYAFDVSNPGVLALDLAPDDPDIDTAEERRANARLVDTLNPGHATLEQPGCSPIEYDSGDANDDGFLDPDEVWRFTCTDLPTKAQSPNQSTIGDEVEVTANGLLPGLGDRSDPVTAADSAQVQVLTPNVELRKSVSATLVRPGTLVAYRYEVENTGDGGISPVGLLDDRCHEVRFESGDGPPANGIIDMGETWVFTCDQVIEMPDTGNTVDNGARLLAVGVFGNLYRRVADATVQVFDPDITLVKTVSQEWVPVGTFVDYTFTVTNSGDDVELDDLDDILLADVASPEAPACRTPNLIDDGDGDDVLSVGEVWTFGCSALITEQTVDIATTSGRDIAGGRVFAADMAFVQAYEAGIAIEKTATPTELPEGGGEVTYTYAVTNTGNVPLADVATRVSDDRCSPVVYVEGDVDENGLLTGPLDLFETGPEEEWIFTCTTTLTETTTNTVVATGTPVRPDPDGVVTLGPDVSASDEAVVEVQAIVPPAPNTTTTLPPVTTTTVARPLPPTGGGSPSRLPVAALVCALGAALSWLARRHGTAHGKARS